MGMFTGDFAEPYVALYSQQSGNIMPELFHFHSDMVPPGVWGDDQQESGGEPP